MHVSITQLRVNPAQSRTRVNAELLATLAMQMVTPDPALPLIIKEGDEGKFNVISGHRRWLAAMIARLTTTKSLEQMQLSVESFCYPNADGWVELSPELYDNIAKVLESFDLPYTLWTGTPAEEIMTLLRANLGAEAPDMVGLAHAFHAAIEKDVSLDELAQAAGMPVAMANAILAIPIIPRVFQDLLNDGRMELELISEIDGLNEVDMRALESALQEILDSGQDPDDMEYSSRIRSALVNLRTEPTEPKLADNHPQEWNKKRIVRRLWLKAIEETPAELAQALALRGLQGMGVSMISLLSGISSAEPYTIRDLYGYGELETKAVDMLEDLDCETCAFSELPTQPLLSPLPLRCRKAGQLLKGGCLDWIPRGKKFALRTPWTWNAGSRVVTNKKQLLEAFQEQRDFELEESPDGAAEVSGSPEMQIQRAQIRQFMEVHVEEPFSVEHPWATACAQCGHLLEESPVKAAPDAPPCTWSKGRRTLRFQAYWPQDEDGDALRPPDVIVPSCLQFAPANPWSDLLPEPDTAPPYPREVMEELVLGLVGAGNSETHSTHSRGMLQFLTGRPEKASDNHRKTFKAKFKTEKDTLSDGQMWTLLRWALLDWRRGRRHSLDAILPIGVRETRRFQLRELGRILQLLKDAEVGEAPEDDEWEGDD